MNTMSSPKPSEFFAASLLKPSVEAPSARSADLKNDQSPNGSSSWLGKLAPLAFARYLIAFFIGVIATLAWQSYRDGMRGETIPVAPASLDLMRQSVDKLAIEIAKLQAAEQDILDRISTPPPRP